MVSLAQLTASTSRRKLVSPVPAASLVLMRPNRPFWPARWSWYKWNFLNHALCLPSPNLNGDNNDFPNPIRVFSFSWCFSYRVRSTERYWQAAARRGRRTDILVIGEKEQNLTRAGEPDLGDRLSSGIEKFVQDAGNYLKSVFGSDK